MFNNNFYLLLTVKCKIPIVFTSNKGWWHDQVRDFSDVAPGIINIGIRVA